MERKRHVTNARTTTENPQFLNLYSSFIIYRQITFYHILGILFGWFRFFWESGDQSKFWLCVRDFDLFFMGGLGYIIYLWFWFSLCQFWTSNSCFSSRLLFLLFYRFSHSFVLISHLFFELYVFLSGRVRTYHSFGGLI
ncbi:hypothetical protein FPQ18DRAFT_39108 [Pyronema domesticum]|uniref:Uncharacterized protein n=1 Tax=Pyronema omphalodes (strain CBS 100304) TaxID=1076935 RepID=U4LWH6_PYROM|nr:hypothetical protein FPQ18DRAFT_39108 [Pyronema domesticum]CCX33778.1 Protein of unknown function [Pyronema omphalodes CBS 100304]